MAATLSQQANCTATFDETFGTRIGSDASDRIPRRSSLQRTLAGFVCMAVCRDRGRSSPMPLPALITRYGELFPLEMAQLHSRGATNAAAAQVRRRSYLWSNTGLGNGSTADEERYVKSM